jgi:hypothetical protein
MPSIVRDTAHLQLRRQRAAQPVLRQRAAHSTRQGSPPGAVPLAAALARAASGKNRELAMPLVCCIVACCCEAAVLLFLLKQPLVGLVPCPAAAAAQQAGKVRCHCLLCSELQASHMPRVCQPVSANGVAGQRTAAELRLASCCADGGSRRFPTRSCRAWRCRYGACHEAAVACQGCSGSARYARLGCLSSQVQPCKPNSYNLSGRHRLRRQSMSMRKCLASVRQQRSCARWCEANAVLCNSNSGRFTAPLGYPIDYPRCITLQFSAKELSNASQLPVRPSWRLSALSLDTLSRRGSLSPLTVPEVFYQSMTSGCAPQGASLCPPCTSIQLGSPYQSGIPPA